MGISHVIILKQSLLSSSFPLYMTSVTSGGKGPPYKNIIKNRTVPFILKQRYMHIYIHTYLHTICVCMDTYMHAWMHKTYIYRNMHSFMHTFMHTCIIYA